jgi:uncharacterized membrane protein YidH (DUF202 family)
MSGPLAGQNVAASEQMFSAWTRHYRLSLAILVGGIVMFVAVIAFAYLGNLTGSYPTSSGSGPVVLAIDVIGSAGFAMIFAGAVFASHNRSLLRQSRQNARPGPPG